MFGLTKLDRVSNEKLGQQKGREIWKKYREACWSCTHMYVPRKEERVGKKLWCARDVKEKGIEAEVDGQHLTWLDRDGTFGPRGTRQGCLEETSQKHQSQIKVWKDANEKDDCSCVWLGIIIIIIYNFYSTYNLGGPISEAQQNH